MALTVNRRTMLGAMVALAACPAGARGPAHYPAPDRELMVPVEGGRIYVRVNGDLAGALPPLVILHGGPGGTHGAYLDALALAGERAVILYDQFDSGRSDWPQNPANWRVARFVDELDAIRRALDVERWHVVGHSWGGTIALEYGARRPQGLASLVLASPLVSTRSWIADANALRGELPLPVRQELARCDTLPAPLPASCDSATGAFYAAFNGREPESEGRIAYRAYEGRGFDAKLYEAMWGRSEFVATGTLKDYDGEPLLAKLDGPRTLFVGGQYDEARPATLQGFAARVPGAEFAVVPGAAHGFFGDRPVETLGILRGWLGRHDL
ncbi:proline iminopeptidase-family hydrolase [Sphingomonas sp.]|jgi:proline iminopeptidase/L-proline amide hydrolase|uniref:proline iminopeptidase-family hydrolase n=1 Tax=Sphingomonas sp. TaxID=28214 RepID=UPI002ED9A7DF